MKNWPTLLISSLVVTSIALNVHFYLAQLNKASSYQCADTENVVYRPVYYNSDKKRSIESAFIIDTSSDDASHYRRIQFVLKLYGHQFAIESGNLLINRKLWEDKDYMANLTAKANDVEWLREQKYVE